MADPDLSQYIDLKIYDKDPTDILNTGLEELKSLLPEWTPREDNTEVMLLQALSVMVAESVYSINRLPGSILTGLLKLYGIDRDAGAFATVDVEFQVQNNLGYTIPRGYRLSLPQQQGFGSLVLETVSGLAVPAGNTSGVVQAQAVTVGDQANGVPAGTRLEVLETGGYFINSVSTVTPIVGGRTEEDDKDWFNRGIQRFGRLTDTLVVPRHFELAAMERPEVNRARALDSYNSDAGSGVVGDHPGHLTMALYGDSSPLSASEKQGVIDSFVDRKFGPLILHTVDPVVTTVNVNITVKPNSGFSNARVVDAVQYALRQWLNTDTWPWKGTVFVNELNGVVAQLPEVDYVTLLTQPAANVILNGAAPLATLGTVNVLLNPNG